MNLSPISDDINEFFDCSNLQIFLNNIHNNINFLCVHVNIRSMIKNFSSLEQVVYSCKPNLDVVVITEANISDNISCLYHLEGYDMYTKLRKTRKGGGIIVYVNKKHKFVKTNTNTYLFECLQGVITTQNNYSIDLYAIYRPPQNSKHLFVEELHKLLRANNRNSDLLVLGDTNIDLKQDLPIKHKYTTTMYNAGLVCGITDFTRIEQRKNNVSKSCIDHIYARSRTQDLYTAVLGTLLADHRMIVIACVGTSPLQGAYKFKTTYNSKKLSHLLNNIEWECTNEFQCPNKIYNFIYNNVRKCYKESETTVKVKLNSKCINANWLNNKIINACERRDVLYNDLRKDYTNKILKLEYNRARNKANKIIQKNKNQIIRNEIIKNLKDPKKLWYILNKITGRIRHSVDNVILNSFSKYYTNSVDIANQFACTFENSVKSIIPTCEKKILDKTTYIKSANVTMRFQKANNDKIDKIIKSINREKAPGCDGIRAFDVKNLCTKITQSITRLINLSVTSGKYPVELKTGIVRPIHKKGPHSDMDNYRPITILPTIDKIIEKYICNQIHTFYKQNSILNCNQYGFQPNKSTTQLLTKFTDSMYEHLNGKKHVLIVFIDYSRAFDTLRHDILLERLEESGIRGPILNWCKNYLEDRMFYVKVGEADSHKIKVTEGTAQGSVLGPVHYITYVNNVVNIVNKSEIYLFADDTCLVAAHTDLDIALKNLQQDFDRLSKWSHDSGLVINASKTKLMYVSSSQNRTERQLQLFAHNHPCLHTKSYRCSCPTIDVVNEYRYLGLIMDNRFKWTSHINSVCNKLRSILAKFRLIKNKIPYKTLLTLYKSLGETVIGYGLGSYGRTSKSHLDLIYELQLRIMKVLIPPKIKEKFYGKYHDLFHYCHILPVHKKVEYSLLVEEYFNKEIQKPVSLKILTRSVSNAQLVVPRYNNLYGKHQLKCTIPTLINNLPTTVKTKINNKNIKFLLKNYYLGKPYCKNNVK